MMGSHCDEIMRSICWCLLACYCLWRHSCTVLSMTNWFSWSLRRTTQIHLFYSGIVPVTISKELWDHVFTSIQMETKFTLRLCWDKYHHEDLGRIRFLIQCSANRLLLLRSWKMVGIPFCVASSSINVLNKTRRVYKTCTIWFSVTLVPKFI